MCDRRGWVQLCSQAEGCLRSSWRLFSEFGRPAIDYVAEDFNEEKERTSVEESSPPSTADQFASEPAVDEGECINERAWGLSQSH